MNSQTVDQSWPKSPKAALFNQYLKNSVVDWGFSDAVLGVGSLHDLFKEAMQQLFVKAASFNADGSKSNNWQEDKDQQFVLITHSLGSYLALSTLDLDHAPGPLLSLPAEATPNSAALYIFAHTSLIYFFANQIPLLELGNIRLPPDSSGDGQESRKTVPGSKFGEYLGRWRTARSAQLKNSVAAGCPSNTQIIAWSDPSDLLTYTVPRLDHVLVANLEVVNATRWLWLLEGASSAHSNYVTNKTVIRLMMKTTEHSCSTER